jgi:hypothetical protein
MSSFMRIFTRSFFFPLSLLFFSLSLSACIETLIRITLRPQGGGAMELHYGIHREFVEKYLIVEKNTLLPITASEIGSWVKRFPGVSLLNYQIEDRSDPQHKGIRLVHLYLIFDDIEAFRLNHVWFAYYPYKNEQIFQFFIHKHMPEDPTASTILIDTITNPFKIRLEVEFPAKILASNATELGWSRAVWEIPLRAVFSGPQTDIVAWARTPRFPSQWIAGWINPIRYWVLGEEWRFPQKLPAILVEPLPGLPENPPMSQKP